MAGLSKYLMSNQAVDQDPEALNALDLYMSGQASAVQPDQSPQAKNQIDALSGYMGDDTPRLAASQGPSQIELQRQMLMAQAPKASPEMDRAMAIANQNEAEAMVRQQQALDEQKAQVAQYAAQKPGIDFRPLAGLSDAWYGGNLSQSANAMAPESAAAKAEKLAALRNQITQGTGQLTKDQMSAIEAQLKQQSYKENRMTKEDIAKMNNLTKLTTSGATQGLAKERLGLMQERLNLMYGKEARSTANNDAILKQYIPRLEGAAKIGELIQSARDGKVVNNQALLGQLNAEIARLETGSQSPGLGQSEKTELQDAKARIASFADSLTGKPSDSVHPEVLDAADKLVNELSGSYTRGIDSRMKYLSSGMTPQQQKILASKHESIKSTYAPRLGGWDGSDGGMVTVTNGKETYQIPKADLPHAMQEGFQVK